MVWKKACGAVTIQSRKIRPNPEAPLRYLIPSVSALIVLLLAGAGYWMVSRPASLTGDERAALYATALDAPQSGMSVFHLGHSLVGRDMPAMVAQLADAAGIEGHRYNIQLGWGTSLRQHWEPDAPIRGFETENDHPRFRDARTALAEGVDALVLTEMIDLRDAIRYHDSAAYLARWARLARSHNPDVRVYLYETWHGLDIEGGWLDRIDRDAEALWEGTILAQAMALDGVGTVHVIPAGRAMAAFARALEARGGLGGLSDRSGLFRTDPETGATDPIHAGDAGRYLVALVHLATLYQVDPRGLPHAVLRADGSPVDPIAPEIATLMQEVVWQVVTRYPSTGVRSPRPRGATP